MVLREQPRESGKAGAARPTVLIVDDDAETLSALRRALRSESYDLLTTADPFVALEWVKSREIGLVITDEFMPAMLGTELLQAIRGSSPDTATVLLTAHPKPDVMFRGFQQRVDLMLAKPWQDQALRDAALRLLRDRSPRSAAEGPAGGRA
jgi:DNA-binding NtrC family response regulator